MIDAETAPQRCLEWTRGNEPAAHFLLDVMHLARRIDDIADGDSRDVGADLSMLVNELMVRVGTNPFYREFQHTLAPMMALVALMWNRADVYRNHSDERVQMTGYVYRESVELLLYMTAYLVGGHAHASAVMDQFVYETRRDMETHREWMAGEEPRFPVVGGKEA